MRLDVYRSAGFVVTRRVPRPEYTAADLLPSLIVSASGDLATFVPDVWSIAWCGVDPDDRQAAAAKLGVPPERVDGLVAAVTARIADAERYGWPNIAYTLDAAWEMARLAAPDGGLLVLELGLAVSDVPALLEASAPLEPPPGTAPLGEPGVRIALRRDLAVLATGRPLGFEPLAFDVALGCSWLCNGLEVPVARELGIRPNSSRAVAYISRDDVGAEPGLWLPWLLLEHSTA
jgi:hypothetical protein